MSEIRFRLAGCTKGVFTRSVLVVMTGTVAAQIISVFGSPFLARLYDPTAFGTFALFVSLAAIAGATSCWAYDWAVVLPDEDQNAASLLTIAIALSLLTSLVGTVVVIVCGERLLSACGIEELSRWVLAAPAAGLMISGHKALTFWSTRRQSFRQLAVSRSLRAVTILLIQTVAGLAGLSHSGLILGFLVGNAAAFALLGMQIWRADRSHFRFAARTSNLRRLAKEHSDFPRYRAPQQLIVATAKSAILIGFAAFFSPSIAGLYSLSQRVVHSPLSMLGQSVQQVFLPNASQTFNHNPQLLYARACRITLGLAAVTFALVSPVLAFGPTLFSWVFGEQWTEAGRYAQVLALGAIFQVTAQPCEVLAPLLQLQRAHLINQVLLMACLFSAIAVGGHFALPMLAVGGYVTVMAVFKIGLLAYILFKLKTLVSTGKPESCSIEH